MLQLFFGAFRSGCKAGFLRYRFSPTLLLALIIPLAVILSLTLYLPEDATKYIVFISAIVLLIGVLITQAVALYSQRQDRAFKLLIANREGEDWRDAAKTLVELSVKWKGKLPQDLLQTWWNPAIDENKKARHAISFIANFFEEMAIGIKFGEVDEALLEEFYGGMLVRFYEYTKPLLPIVRNYPPSKDCPYGEERMPEVHCNMEYLYNRWQRKHEERTSRLIALENN